MGTTLTGTTPQDTYDSLIKVTDNGPLSGTAKYLSDGLGNDSVLALSTAGVGIGTTSPSTFVQISKAQTATTRLQITNAQTGGSTSIRASLQVTANDRIGAIEAVNGDNIYVGAASNHNVALMSNGAGVLIGTPAGNVGIGTSTPAVPLDVVGNIRSSTGILFGTDTAAANLLDDYEEGTWTMGISFDFASVGATFSNNTGTYTKIGRQVTVNGLLQFTNKGSSTGTARVTGLPFTIPASVSNYASASIWFNNVSFAGQFASIGTVSTTLVELWDISSAGVITALNNTNFANNSEVMISFTYFV